ncbi:hypothetical protein JW835_02770 [bacterium]|nr:hypothetical protein [bacterium]
MKKSIVINWIWILIFILAALIACERIMEPENEIGHMNTINRVKGFVYSRVQPDQSIAPAYIIMEDSLLAITDNQGAYVIDSLEIGIHFITCSALNYRDTTVQINVSGTDTINMDFYLTPDRSTGRIYGEFHDIPLFNEIIQNEPEKLTWDDQQMFEGTTGATIQKKWLHYDIPQIYLYLGDSLISGCDAFGQFWCELQSGTYPIRGTCGGYQDAVQVVKVLPDEKTYVNFFMERTNIDTRIQIDWSFNGPRYEGDYYPPTLQVTSDYAIWIENDAGEFIKTLQITPVAVTVDSAQGSHIEHLPSWLEASGTTYEDLEQETDDGVAPSFDGLTASSPYFADNTDIKTMTVYWDRKDAEGQTVLPGIYYCVLESANIIKAGDSASGTVTNFAIRSEIMRMELDLVNQTYQADPPTENLLSMEALFDIPTMARLVRH